MAGMKKEKPVALYCWHYGAQLSSCWRPYRKRIRRTTKLLSVYWRDQHTKVLYLVFHSRERNEILQEYGAKIVRLLNFFAQTGDFINGLQDEKIQCLLRIKNYQILSNTILHVLEYEAIVNMDWQTKLLEAVPGKEAPFGYVELLEQLKTWWSCDTYQLTVGKCL